MSTAYDACLTLNLMCHYAYAECCRFHVLSGFEEAVVRHFSLTSETLRLYALTFQLRFGNLMLLDVFVPHTIDILVTRIQVTNHYTPPRNFLKCDTALLADVISSHCLLSIITIMGSKQFVCKGY